MFFSGFIHKCFPSTNKKLARVRKKRKKLLPIFSLASLMGFFTFLSAVLAFDKAESPVWGASIIIGYALTLFISTAGVIIADRIEIAEEIFEDYCNWPKSFHVSIIISSVVGVFALIFAKLYATLHLLKNDKPSADRG